MFYFMVCMMMLTLEVAPPPNVKWWHCFTLLITWPEHLGRWIKANFEKGE